MRRLLASVALIFALSPALCVAAETPAQIDDEILPPVFVETLLELPDDAAQAARSGKTRPTSRRRPSPTRRPDIFCRSP